MRIKPERSSPLGATHDGFGTNSSLFSEVAELVELALGAMPPPVLPRGHRRVASGTWRGSCPTGTACRTATGTGTRPARSACSAMAKPSPNQIKKATGSPTFYTPCIVVNLRRSNQVGFLQVRALRRSEAAALSLADTGVVVTS